MSITTQRRQWILALISAGMFIPGSGAAQVRKQAGMPRTLVEQVISADTQTTACSGNRMTNGNFEDPPLRAATSDDAYHGNISRFNGWSGAWHWTQNNMNWGVPNVFSPAEQPYGWASWDKTAKPVTMTGSYAALYATWWQPFGSGGAWRRGMVNTLASPIAMNSGNYELSFKVARLEYFDKRLRHADALNTEPKKLAVYGVYIPPNTPLPAPPTSLEHPMDYQLFGVFNTTLLGTIDLHPVQMDGNWIAKSLSFDSKFWVQQWTNRDVVNLVNSIYITPVKNNSPYGNAHVFALDDFCLVSKSRPAS